MKILQILYIQNYTEPVPKCLHALSTEFTLEVELILRFRLCAADGIGVFVNHPHCHKLLHCFKSVLASQPNYKSTFRVVRSIPCCICPCDTILGAHQVPVYWFYGVARGLHPSIQSLLYFAHLLDQPTSSCGGVEVFPSFTFHIYSVHSLYPQRFLHDTYVPCYFAYSCQVPEL